MSDYSQTRSFNLGIAEDTSIEAAMIYDDLVYAQKVFGEGYFFRSDEQMLKRFPIMSKSTIRRNVAKLVEAGLISTVVKKVNGKPVLNYQIEHSLLFNLTKTKEIVNLTKTYNIETKKKLNSPAVDFGAAPPHSATPPVELNNYFRDTKESLKYLISIINPREKVTAERLRMLNARRKEYTPEEIFAAAHAFSKSDWHKENKQMSIDNLLAPSKFGRWYTKGQEATPSERVTVENQDEMVRRRLES